MTLTFASAPPLVIGQKFRIGRCVQAAVKAQIFLCDERN